MRSAEEILRDMEKLRHELRDVLDVAIKEAHQELLYMIDDCEAFEMIARRAKQHSENLDIVVKLGRVLRTI